MKKPIFIAEVKPHSPYDGPTGSSWEELFDIANEYGDWLSIHTNPKWHGSFDLLEKARKMTHKPILAKGYHYRDNEIARAVDAGADYVLVVGRMPGVHLEKCVIEPLNIMQLTTDLADMPEDQRVLWNQRDLKDGSRKPETYLQARQLWTGWLGVASMIEFPTDVHRSADAFIVGTSLPDFVTHQSHI